MEIIYTKTGKYAIDPVYGPVISCYMKMVDEQPEEYAIKLIDDKWAVKCPEVDPGPDEVDEVIEEMLADEEDDEEYVSEEDEEYEEDEDEVNGFEESE